MRDLKIHSLLAMFAAAALIPLAMAACSRLHREMPVKALGAPTPSWNYAAFMDDPEGAAPTAVPAPPAPPEPSTHRAACLPGCDCGGERNPILCGDVCLCARHEAPPKTEAIDHWEGSDAAGLRWQSKDPEELREFLRRRNASLGAPQVSFAPGTAIPAYCPPGRS